MMQINTRIAFLTLIYCVLASPAHASDAAPARPAISSMQQFVERWGSQGFTFLEKIRYHVNGTPFYQGPTWRQSGSAEPKSCNSILMKLGSISRSTLGAPSLDTTGTYPTVTPLMPIAPKKESATSLIKLATSEDDVRKDIQYFASSIALQKEASIVCLSWLSALGLQRIYFITNGADHLVFDGIAHSPIDIASFTHKKGFMPPSVELRWENSIFLHSAGAVDVIYAARNLAEGEQQITDFISPAPGR